MKKLRKFTKRLLGHTRYIETIRELERVIARRNAVIESNYHQLYVLRQEVVRIRRISGENITVLSWVDLVEEYWGEGSILGDIGAIKKWCDEADERWGSNPNAEWYQKGVKDER